MNNLHILNTTDISLKVFTFSFAVIVSPMTMWDNCGIFSIDQTIFTMWLLCHVTIRSLKPPERTSITTYIAQEMWTVLYLQVCFISHMISVVKNKQLQYIRELRGPSNKTITKRHWLCGSGVGLYIINAVITRYFERNPSYVQGTCSWATNSCSFCSITPLTTQDTGLTLTGVL